MIAVFYLPFPDRAKISQNSENKLTNNLPNSPPANSQINVLCIYTILVEILLMIKILEKRLLTPYLLIFEHEKYFVCLQYHLFSFLKIHISPFQFIIFSNKYTKKIYTARV